MYHIPQVCLVCLFVFLPYILHKCKSFADKCSPWCTSVWPSHVLNKPLTSVVSLAIFILHKKQKMALYRFFAKAGGMPMRVPSLSEKETKEANTSVSSQEKERASSRYLSRNVSDVRSRIIATAYRSFSFSSSPLQDSCSPKL